MARKRNRRTASTDLQCTCHMHDVLDPDPTEEHDSGCDLWHLTDFVNGLIDWNPVARRVEATLNPWAAHDDDEWGRSDAWDAFDAFDGVDGFGKHVCADDDVTTMADLTAAPFKTTGGTVPKRWNSCRHNMTPVHLPDGTLVHASASTDVRQNAWGHRANAPQWAVYLTPAWYPSGLALFLPWQDYGTPTCSWRDARTIITEFFGRARHGQTVEVGCMGGHGRTGTFLACLVLLADPNMTPEAAIKWVRTHYCSKAVEDESQEWFVKWFDNPAVGPWVPPPPKPRPNVVPATKGKGKAKGQGNTQGLRCLHTIAGSILCTLPMGHTGQHKHVVLPPQCGHHIATNSKTGEQYHCTADDGHTGHHRFIPSQVRTTDYKGIAEAAWEAAQKATGAK